MTATRLYVSLLAFALAAVFLSITGCQSGGDNTPDEGTVPPSITSLDRNSANIGDTVTITGQRFGQTMNDSSVTLNGMQFQVVAWTDTLLTVTVVQGMTSGIVVVTVDNASSTSGQEAQLFIPSAPVGDPVLSAISPDFGVEGTDTVLLTGFNFGDGTGDSGVYFPAQGGAVSQAGGVVLAPVVNVDIDGSPVPQWSSNAIKVTVPENSESGQVFVRVNGVDTNTKPFSVMPREVTGPPVIYSQSNNPPGLEPAKGSFNSAVTVNGENFGNKRGSSTITISDIAMPVISWSNSKLVVLVPMGATSAPIRLTVGGETAESAVFEIENAPIITGMSPTELRVGKALTITGKNFGFDQGGGTLKVGSTTVAPTTWNDNTIFVEKLPVISFNDPDAVPVTVTNDIGGFDTVFGTVRSDMEVFVTATPDAGEAGTTQFNFFVTVIGGSGSYRFTLIPDANNPSSKQSPTTSTPLVYTYPESMISQPGFIPTRIEVEDTVSGDVAVVDGPEVYVVPQGLAVISSIQLKDFNNPTADSPKNDRIYNWVPPVFDSYAYNDFTFFNNEIWFGSAFGEVMDGGNPVTGITRDLSEFKSDGGTPRPYGYRYNDGQGSIVRINGLNLGTSGEIYLNSNGPASGKPGYHLDPGDLVPGAWTNDYIEFYLPQDAFQNLSGKIWIETNGFGIQSSGDLICSTLIRDVQPDGEIDPDASFSVTGYDFEPPLIDGITGEDTYLMFVVQADYTDPFTSTPDTGPALYAHPVPVSPSGSSLLFQMNNLGGGGQVEVFNAAGDAAEYVTGTLTEGQYLFWIWSGSLADGSEFLRGQSGIFSQLESIQVGPGGGGPGDFWSITGTTQDGSVIPADPIPNINVYIEAKAGFPPYSDTVVSDGGGTYTFTDVPGDADYEVWCDDPNWLWGSHRETGLLTSDLTFFNIISNGPV